MGDILQTVFPKPLYMLGYQLDSVYFCSGGRQPSKQEEIQVGVDTLHLSFSRRM